MIRTIVFVVFLILSTGFAAASDTRNDSSTTAIVTLKKEQLGALSAAIHRMQQIKRSYKGQQVVIRDKGDVFHVSFFDDPINIAVAGDQNGIGWVVRKKDQKVLRPFLIR